MKITIAVLMLILFSALAAADSPKVLEIQARNFVASDGVEIGTLNVAEYGNDTVHNSAPYAEKYNMVIYQFGFDNNYTYELWVQYAAAASRPCTLSWNNKVLQIPGALGATTGGWNLEHQKWQKQGVLATVPGTNTLKIERHGVFPHILGIRLVRVGQFP